MAIMLLCLFSQELLLDEVSGNFPFGYERAALAEDGSFLYAGTDQLCHWAADGRLLRVLPVANILAFQFSGERYAVSHETSGGARETLLFDANGNLLRSLASYSAFYTLIGGTPYGPHGDGVPAADADPFPHLLCRLGADYTPVDGGARFFKTTAAQLELGYRFNRVWVAELEGAAFAVGELEDDVFFLEAESAGEATPNRLDPIPLELPGFIKYQRLQRPGESREEWLDTFSRITLFARYRDGFIAAYLIPVTGRQMVRTMGPSFGGVGILPVPRHCIAIGAQGNYIVSIDPASTRTAIAPVVLKQRPTYFSDLRGNPSKP